MDGNGTNRAGRLAPEISRMLRGHGAEEGSGRPGGEEDGGEVRPSGRLLRLAASCPRCGSRPAMRVTETLVRCLRTEPAAARVGTYQCQRRGCGTIYDLTASAYQRGE